MNLLSSGQNNDLQKRILSVLGQAGLTEEEMDELTKLIKADLSEEEFHEYLKRKIEEFKDNRN